MGFSYRAFPISSTGGRTCNDGANIWAARINGANVTLQKINKNTGVVSASYVIATAANANGPAPIVFAGGFLWVACVSNLIIKVDLNGNLQASYPVVNAPGSSVQATIAVCADPTNIWVACTYFDNAFNFIASAIKLSQATGAFVSESIIGTDINDLCFDGANIWTANSNDGAISQILAATGAILNTYVLGGRPYLIIFDGAALWVADSSDPGALWQVSAATGAILQNLPLNAFSFTLAFDGKNVWVICTDTDTFTTATVFIFRATDGTNLITQAISVVNQFDGTMTFDGVAMWSPFTLTIAAQPVIIQMLFSTPTTALIDPYKLAFTSLPYCVADKCHDLIYPKGKKKC